MQRNKRLMSRPLRSAIFFGALSLAIPLSGCGTSPDESAAASSTTQANEGQASGPSGASIPNGTQNDSSSSGDSAGEGGEESSASSNAKDAGSGSDSTKEEGSPSGDTQASAGSDSSGATDKSGPSDESTATQGSSSDDATATDASGQPEEGEDLHFTFVVPGASEPFSARVVGGPAGSSIFIDKFPQSCQFNLTYGLLPTGYPDQLDADFCREIEGYVESVEKDTSASALVRQHLRETYPTVNLMIPFGLPLTVELTIAAGDAAKAAGAHSSRLRIENGPKFKDLALAVTFTEDSLTRRMGEHEEARKEFQNQLARSEGVLFDGRYAGGTNWPDFLCDLYTKRAQMSITIQEDGWSTVSKSQTVARAK